MHKTDIEGFVCNRKDIHILSYSYDTMFSPENEEYIFWKQMVPYDTGETRSAIVMSRRRVKYYRSELNYIYLIE